MEELVSTQAALWFSPSRECIFGSPAESILQIAPEHNSDLIVLGLGASASAACTVKCGRSLET